MAVALKNPGPIAFQGVIHTMDSGGAYVEFPGDVESLFGTSGRVPIRVAFEGIPYRGSLVRMGLPCHFVPILKDIRERLGKGEGDKIRVVVELDDQPRVIVLSKDTEAAFRKARVLPAFRAMAYSHQREYHLWIEDAKRPETRKARIEKAVAEILKSGPKAR